MRGATISRPPLVALVYGFQSTHPMRGATLRLGAHGAGHGISIHAPHAGCDNNTDKSPVRDPAISIHAPHAGCDQEIREAAREQPPFQSTHPMRGATAPSGVPQVPITISIHAPHAGCDSSKTVLRLTFELISIHAPHAGCDPFVWLRGARPPRFQSTHPMRGATRRPGIGRPWYEFQSTHPMRGATVSPYATRSPTL